MKPSLFIISEDVSFKKPYTGIGVVATNLAVYLKKNFDVKILTVGFHKEAKKIRKNAIEIFNIFTPLSKKCNNIYELWGKPLSKLIEHRQLFVLKASKFIEKEKNKIGEKNIVVITNHGIGCKELKKINVKVINVFHFLHSQQICSFIFPRNDLSLLTLNKFYVAFSRIMKKVFRSDKNMAKFLYFVSELNLFPISIFRYIYLYEIEPLLFADYNITISDDMKNYFLQNFSTLIKDPKRIVMISNGIEEKFFDTPINNFAIKKFYLKYGFSPDDLILLFIGRINPVKGIHYLLKALEKFEKFSNKNIKLLICGSYFPSQKNYFDSLKRIALKLKNCQVIFEDFVSENKKIFLYDIADIVIVPSVYEPFSLVASEALARGKKVVVSNRVGCRNLVIEGNGIVIDYSEDFVEELANNLLKISRKKIKKFNKTTRNAVKKFKWKNIAKKYLNILLSN
jgi:glycosyltransferase involved in cell wall biosynthesis